MARTAEGRRRTVTSSSCPAIKSIHATTRASSTSVSVERCALRPPKRTLCADAERVGCRRRSAKGRGDDTLE